ncbi:hypothetical protein ACFS27_13355 [Promicromonospora vindobonensis]|uniref:Secreted protein n=1 Tax=Promicromonospora vindobonensis TaxID=195748 RepID=A0ABW5VS38_9MICO
MSVLTVMFLVLAVLGVQAVCGVHLDEAGHTSALTDAGAGHHAASAGLGTSDQATEADLGHHGDDPSHCSEERTATARYDRTLSPFPDLAQAPDLAQQWLVPGIAHHAPRGPSGLAVAAAPSLHALGISRT